MNRSFALDALRGYAILTMILSGRIVFGVLPGWMHHAQTPPPSYAFDPTVPGITWVDLVFPFFIFAMGAAFPFSIKGKLEQGVAKGKLVYEGFKRYLQLIFFAVFTYHVGPWALKTPDPSTAYWVGILGFILLFPMYMRMPFDVSNKIRNAIKLLAFLAGLTLMLWVQHKGYRDFNPHFEDIIIAVMAHMAGFGTLVYVLTVNSVKARLLILPILMGILLGAEAKDSINSFICNYAPLSWIDVSGKTSHFIPLDWFFRFTYLKYFLILIPGTIAGEYLRQSLFSNTSSASKVRTPLTKNKPLAILFICLITILINLCCLYNRWLVVNLFLNIGFLSLGYFLLRNSKNEFAKLWEKLFNIGSFLILLGLMFESFQGGIKKDPTTYSYFFLTGGLAFLALIFFNIVCDYWKCQKSSSFLIMSGQNPMIAYVSNNLFIVPILSLLQIMPHFSVFGSNAWLGFLQGVILTLLAILITMFFTKIKWFWRT